VIRPVRRDATQYASSSNASPGARARFAFTLIEILVATGIVVALLAVATPAIVSAFGDRRIEAEAERLGAALASLKAEAVRRRETLAMYLEPAAGDYGGELFIGPLERSGDAPAFDDSGVLEPVAAGAEDGIRMRSVFSTGRPLLLCVERPAGDPLQGMLSGPTGDSVGGSALEAQRIRIAVCTASGQMLASRPLWLSDERSMMSVEIGMGVGNAIVSQRRIIPDGQQLLDDDTEDRGSAEEPLGADRRPVLPEGDSP